MVNAADKKNATLCWVPSDIGVPLNERADVSAGGATEGHVANSAVPRSDMKIQIKSKVKDSWQNECQNTTNKLRTVKAVIEPYQYSSFCNREWEVKLCHLKIGHSRITRVYLMEAANRR